MRDTDIIEALRRGHDAKDRDRAAEELTKLGQLRGGTSGLVDAEGQLYGKCARLAWLRLLGLELPLEHPETREMFEMGVKQEDIVVDLLTRGLPAGYTPAVGEAAAIKYTRPDGVVVSMRPDVLILGPEGPQLSIELKMVASIWTALSVGPFDRRPKSDHLIQAALYSAKRGKIPSVLLYSNRVEWHVSTAPRWLQAKFGADHPNVEYKDDGTPLKIRPFNQAYYLTWRPDGHLEYQTEGMARPCATVITEAGLDKYHDFVLQLRDGSALGARPCGLGVDGSKSYNPCDYCQLSDVCDAHEANRNVWLDQVQLKLGSEK